MEGYDNLVSKVLANESLANAAKNMVDEHCLNLVNPDWSTQLQNNVTYQNYIYHAKKLWKPAFSTDHCDWEESKKDDFEIVLVATCKFLKQYKKESYYPNSRRANLLVLDSEPLAKIARAMTSDLGPDVNVWKDHKFPFVECGFMACNECSEFTQKFQKAGYRVSRINQPCISDTKVFDGERVVNRFYSQMEEMFNDTFLAVLRLQLNTRYYLKKQNVYRISGEVLDFVGFLENKLKPTKKVDLGPLIQFEYKPETPSIKYEEKKSAVLDSKVKCNDGFDDFNEIFENEEPLAIEEKGQSSDQRKRQRSSPDDEGETETKKLNMSASDDYEIEKFLFKID